MKAYNHVYNTISVLNDIDNKQNGFIPFTGRFQLFLFCDSRQPRMNLYLLRSLLLELTWEVVHHT